jgi:hypothetical protein
VRFLLFLILFGCASHEKCDPPKDWEEIYRKELIIAIKNEDKEAWYFFLPEYIKAVNENSKPTKSTKKVN